VFKCMKIAKWLCCNADNFKRIRGFAFMRYINPQVIDGLIKTV